MDSRIFSGETTLIESDEFEWQKNISSGEYLDIESIEIGVNNTISLRKKIPFYKYIINFLLIKYQDRLDLGSRDIGEISSQIFESIEAKEKNEDLEKLANLIVELFMERELAPEKSKSEVYGSLDYKKEDRKIWRKTQIRKDLKANVISRDKMFIYAFGLGMNLDELEGFLMKVLEETGLNIWDKKEALIYIALKHFPNNPINFFIRANQLYEDDNNLIEYKKKDTSLNTSILQNSLDDYLDEYKNAKEIDDNLILSIISYHKDLVSENTNRTILNEFISTFNSIEEFLADEIAAFSNIKYGNDDGSTTNAEYFSMGKVNISYKNTEDKIISKDEPFVFKSKNTGEEKIYYPIHDYTLVANPDGGDKDIMLRSAFYEDKNQVPILGTGEEYSDFSYVNNISDITKVDHDSIYISEKRLSSLLTYLYNEDALILREDSKLVDEQVKALDELLKETKIRHENLNAIIEKGKISQITRSRLITLYFISYVLNNADIWFDKLATPARRKRDYLIFMDYKLRNARLYEYNISNPYEETLLKLVVYDEPLDAFRDLWAKYLVNIGDN